MAIIKVNLDGEDIRLDGASGGSGGGNVLSVNGKTGTVVITYEEFSDKPKINGTTLSGNKLSSDLGILSSSDTENIDIDFSNFFN